VYLVSYSEINTMANMKIEDVEGIGPSYGEKLRAAGIPDTDALLKIGCTPSGRKDLVEKTGLSSSNLLKWINMVDLFRVKGIGAEFAELLEVAGVDTVKELATRNVSNLVAKMAEVNEAKNLTRRVPSEKEVIGWVDEAKSLPAMIKY